MRKTSLDAYEHLVKNNLLRHKQALIIARLIYGDATSGEVIGEIVRSRPKEQRLPNVNAWRARFTELRERGLIVEAGERRWKVTGRRGIVWRFTGRTKPLKTTRVRRGAKAWKALAMDLWADVYALVPDTKKHLAYKDRIRALGGKP